MRRYKVPGLSLAYIRDRPFAWAEAFGLRDKETNSALTPETVFEAASLSKPAYSYVVLKLVELGKFNLERPLLELRCGRGNRHTNERTGCPENRPPLLPPQSLTGRPTVQA